MYIITYIFIRINMIYTESIASWQDDSDQHMAQSGPEIRRFPEKMGCCMRGVLVSEMWDDCLATGMCCTLLPITFCVFCVAS